MIKRAMTVSAVVLALFLMSVPEADARVSYSARGRGGIGQRGYNRGFPSAFYGYGNVFKKRAPTRGIFSSGRSYRGRGYSR